MKDLDEKKLLKLTNELSLTYFNQPFRHRVAYNQRLRTTGGRYIPQAKKIEINPKYVVEMEREDYIGIIKHELCHYHLHIQGKGFRHGDQEFKQLLKETGSPRHCRPLPSSKKRFNYIYECSKCGYVYKRVRRVNVKKYHCGKCRGRINKRDKLG